MLGLQAKVDGTSPTLGDGKTPMLKIEKAEKAESATHITVEGVKGTAGSWGDSIVTTRRIVSPLPVVSTGT